MNSPIPDRKRIANVDALGFGFGIVRRPHVDSREMRDKKYGFYCSHRNTYGGRSSAVVPDGSDSRFIG